MVLNLPWNLEKRDLERIIERKRESSKLRKMYIVVQTSKSIGLLLINIK